MPLGKAVFQSLDRKSPKLPAFAQTLLRELFTTGDHTGFGVGPSDALPAVQRWIDGSALQGRVLSQPGHQLATAFAPMLVWAFNQPWAGDIRLPVALRKWRFLATDGQSIPAQIKHAGVLANMLVESLPFAAQPLPNHFYPDVYDALDAVVGLNAAVGLRYNAKEITAITDVAIALGHLAWFAPNALGCDGVELQTRWSQRWTPMWDSMTYSQNMESIYTTLDSSLPDSQKWRALSYTSPGHWEHELIAKKMQKLDWPKSEYEFSLVLPWVDHPRGDPSNTASSQLYTKAIEDNKALLQKFCPSFVENIMLLATEDDWASSTQMKAWAELARPKPVAESLPLPVEYDTKVLHP